MTRAQLLFALPTVLGAAVAVSIAGVVLWPQWRQIEVARNRLEELRALKAQLPLLTRQLERESQGVVQARAQQATVLQLIAGSGSLATFMAQVDRLASASGVKLSLFEPLAAAVPKAGEKDAPQPPADSLLAPGLTKQEQLLTAVGSYPALLAFMRQLEKLNVLVVQSNLQLATEEQKAQPAPGQPSPVLPVQLKMSVASYVKQ